MRMMSHYQQTGELENNLRKSPKGLVALFQEDVLIGIGIASGVAHPDI